MLTDNIVEIGCYEYQAIKQGITTKLSLVGVDEWLLTRGDNKLKNRLNGSFYSKKYSNLLLLEAENPEWKGISLLVGDCPIHNNDVKH